MKYLLKQLTFSLLVSLITMACSSAATQKRLQFYTNSGEMQKEVSKFIAVGMSVQKTKQILTNNKFDCRDRKNDSFVIEKIDKNGFPLEDTIVEGDYLWCSTSRSYFISSTSWNVFVLYKKDKAIMIHSSIQSQNF
jgi:hypothetical protein